MASVTAKTCTATTVNTFDIAPGDWCPGNDDDTWKCYGNATCSSNKCTLDVGDTPPVCYVEGTGGVYSAEQKACPLGYYCPAGGDSTTVCAAIKKNGETCTTSTECGLLSYCNTTATEAADKKCMYIGTTANGVVIPANDYTWCASGHVNTTGTTAAPVYTCTEGYVAKENSGSSATFDDESSCEYTYLGEDGNTYTYTTPALCGFNQDELYRCPVYQSDTLFKGTWTKWIEAIASVKPNENCNLGSAGLGAGSNTPYCVALIDNVGKTFYQDAAKMGFVVAGEQGWPNVANNADCVKATITDGYWFESSNAVMISLTAMFSVLIAMIGF